MDGYDADGNKVGTVAITSISWKPDTPTTDVRPSLPVGSICRILTVSRGSSALSPTTSMSRGTRSWAGPNGEYYREDGKPWTCHWEVVTPDDYLREKYGDRSYRWRIYYSLFMKYYNKVYGTLDPSYQQAVDDAKAALEAAQAKASAANAASADRAAAETAVSRRWLARRRPFPPMRRRSPPRRRLCRMRRRRRAMLRFSLMRRMPKLPASRSSRMRRRSEPSPMRRPWRMPSRLPPRRTLSSRLRRQSCPMLARCSMTCRQTSLRPRKSALLPLRWRWLPLR